MLAVRAVNHFESNLNKFGKNSFDFRKRRMLCHVSGGKSAREWDLCPAKDVRIGVSDPCSAIEVYG